MTIIDLISNHEVQRIFTQWLISVNHDLDKLIFPNLKTYLAKTMRDVIEFENQGNTFINTICSTQDFLIEDIHVDSIDGHNWAESIDLSIYKEAVKERSLHSTVALSQRQQAYLDETTAELKILKKYELAKRM